MRSGRCCSSSARRRGRPDSTHSRHVTPATSGPASQQSATIERLLERLHRRAELLQQRPERIDPSEASARGWRCGRLERTAAIPGHARGGRRGTAASEHGRIHRDRRRRADSTGSMHMAHPRLVRARLSEVTRSSLVTERRIHAPVNRIPPIGDGLGS